MGEEANNLEECLRDAESERDRLRARVAEVEAENAERDAAHKADADLAASLHLENAGLRATVERLTAELETTKRLLAESLVERDRLKNLHDARKVRIEGFRDVLRERLGDLV